MGSVSFSGVDGWLNQARREIRAFEQLCVQEVVKAATTVVIELMKGTPVWSGETVRNYGVEVGGLSSGGRKEPIDNGPPGDTNQAGKGPLGPERRRDPNETAALSEVAAALKGMRKLQNVTVVNNIDEAKWNLVDGGSVPTPGLVRYPGGVAMLAQQRARGKLVNFR